MGGVRPVQRVKRNAPLAEDSTRAPPDNVAACSPSNTRVYAVSNAIVGHAARVHASPGPTVSVCPESANAPLHVLQSTRVDRRPSAKVTV